MKTTVKQVMRGLATLLPLGLTLYVIVWLLTWAESLSKPALLWLLPDRLYFPGLGLVATLAILFLVGLLVNAIVVRHIIAIGERCMERIPLVKSLYGAIRDVMKVFSLGDKENLGTVVSVDVGNDTHLIGFITGEETGRRLFGKGDGEGAGERVGVYLPMSYQIGGFTIYVTRDRLTKLDMGFEEAMRITITGGVQGK